MQRFTNLLLFALILSWGGAGHAQTVAANNAATRQAKAEALIQQALACEGAGDLKGAIRVFQRLLQITPRDVRAIDAIAGLYGKLGQIQKELFWAKIALTMDPQYPPAYINYGHAMIAQHRFGEGIKAFERARRLMPESPIPVYNLGVVAEGQQNFAEALRYYQQAVQLDPAFENGHFNLAAAYANLERYDEAVVHLNKTLALNPQSAAAKAMLRQIEQVRRAK